MYARQLAPATAEKAARLNRATLAQFGWAMLRSRGKDVEFRRRVGALALAAEKAGATPSEQERLDVIGSRLVSTDWPERPLVITAVDAETGEFHAVRPRLRRPALQAVAASCAVPGVYPPVHDRRAALHRRRHALGGQRRPRPRLRPARRPRADPARDRPDGQRRRAGDRHGVAGRRRLAGRRTAGRRSAERARPRGPGAVGRGRAARRRRRWRQRVAEVWTG